MCKGDFVYWKCFLDASSIYFFSNVAPEFTVIANWQVAGFRALVQPSDPGVRYPQTTVSPNIKSFTIVRVMFIVTRSQIMEHSQTLKDEIKGTTSLSILTNLSLSSILLASRIAKISQAVSKILKEVKIINLLTFLFSYLNSMTNTNAVSILASLYTYNFCLAINTVHTRLLLSLYFCLFRHLPTLKKLSLEK